MARINKTYVCRDCGESFDGNRLCPACGSPALVRLGRWVVVDTALFIGKKTNDAKRLSVGKDAR